ncbi:MAG: glycine cleavage system protein GcvH [bacterium]
MSIPSKLRYTDEHEWVMIEGKHATVGITDYAQGELGDIVFVELGRPGGEVEKGEAFGTIEAVKAVSELFSPMDGKIVQANEALEDDPMIINRDPYGDGWMIKLEVDPDADLDHLLSAAEYRELIGD